MKRIYVYIGAAAISVAVVAAAAAALLLSVEPYLAPDQVSSGDPSVFFGYLLTLRDGYVVIMSAADDTVVGRYDTPQDTLPSFDRELLKNGVYFETLDEARSAAADFCG